MVCQKAPICKRYFHTPCAKFAFAYARVKNHALNWALHTSCEKIVFDTWVRKWFYPRLAFSPLLRSGANVHTRIKSLSRTSIEMCCILTILDLIHFFMNLLHYLLIYETHSVWLWLVVSSKIPLSLISVIIFQWSAIWSYKNRNYKKVILIIILLKDKLLSATLSEKFNVFFRSFSLFLVFFCLSLYLIFF